MLRRKLIGSGRHALGIGDDMPNSQQRRSKRIYRAAEQEDFTDPARRRSLAKELWEALSALAEDRQPKKHPRRTPNRPPQQR